MYRAVIIDDEKWVIKSLTATIKGQEYFEIVGEAYDGINGLKLIEEQKPDLAFVDIQMPGMGGLDLLQTSNDNKLNTLFIMISGYAEFAYAQKAMFYDAIGYCLKPFSKSELFDALLKAYQEVKAQEKTLVTSDKDMQVNSNHTKVNNKLVQTMLDYIHEHYQEDVSIQDLADLCYINSNYASQLFSQEVNITFSTYLSNLRIHMATELLTNGDLPVAIISEQIGYHDYFYFAKVFKKITGVTPTAYRNKANLSTH